MKPLRFLSVALISLSLLGLEMIWTRILSAEFFYTFAFLALSLAIMGLGLGGLTLRLCSFLNRDSLVGPILAAAGLMALLGPPLVVSLGLSFNGLFSEWLMLGKFLLTITLLSSTFFLAGIALALYFRRFNREMPRIYMADLLGAGAGVLVAVWLMNALGTPVAAFLFAVPILLASLFTSWRWMKIVPVALIGVALYLCPQGKTLLEADRQEMGPVVYKHWDAMAKLKLYDFGGQFRSFNIDNVANSPIVPFDGHWDPNDTTDSGWDVDVRYLVKQFDSCTFLSLGAGGGMDVLQALEHRATEIHAVEVNPQMNYMMQFGDSCGYLEYEAAYALKAREDSIAAAAARADSAAMRTADSVSGSDSTAGDSDQAEQPAAPPTPPPPVFRDSTGRIITLAQYSGYIYSDPRVRVITEDARTYVKRFKNKFDLIFSSSSNTWAALGSGSFALAENYIFTTEAFEDYWEAMTDRGFLTLEHQMYMPRIVPEVIEALTNLGVKDPTAHFAVYDLPSRRRNLLLLSKQPLTDSLRYYAFGPLTPEVYEQRHLLYPAPDSLQDNLINRIVTQGWKDAADSAAIDISPATDNRPFVAQFGLWRNFSWDNLKRVNNYSELFMGFPLSKLVIVLVLLVVVVVLIPLNLIPYFKSGPKLAAAGWFYFFAIGVGFMMLEVVLIQKYALVIGASVYSIATVLLTMLLASGIGSRFARSVSDSTVFTAIVVWLLLDVFVFGMFAPAIAGLSILGRSLVVALWIAPLGFFMGMPFPKGTLRAGELIDWGFSVNGAASVFGATLVVLIAFSFGFTVALLLGGLVYLIAWRFLSMKSAW